MLSPVLHSEFFISLNQSALSCQTLVSTIIYSEVLFGLIESICRFSGSTWKQKINHLRNYIPHHQDCGAELGWYGNRHHLFVTAVVILLQHHSLLLLSVSPAPEWRLKGQRWKASSACLRTIAQVVYVQGGFMCRKALVQMRLTVTAIVSLPWTFWFVVSFQLCNLCILVSSDCSKDCLWKWEAPHRALMGSRPGPLETFGYIVTLQTAEWHRSDSDVPHSQGRRSATAKCAVQTWVGTVYLSFSGTKCRCAWPKQHIFYFIKNNN